VSACFFFHQSGSEEKQGDTGEGTERRPEGGWQGVRESAVSAKVRLGLLWRETGAVRNARSSRGQAASSRKRAGVENASAAIL
jgi:hypothetical protein